MVSNSERDGEKAKRELGRNFISLVRRHVAHAASSASSVSSCSSLRSSRVSRAGRATDGLSKTEQQSRTCLTTGSLMLSASSEAEASLTR